MTLIFEDEYLLPFPFEAKELAETVIEYCLDYEHCPYEAEVNLLLTSNDEIQRLNHEFRSIDLPTDVLSFPAIFYETPGSFEHLDENHIDYFHPETGELIMGDIVISKDKVFSQAESFGHSVKREFCFLIAHSMLHLMGYDHVSKEESVIMERKQSEILEHLQIRR